MLICKLTGFNRATKHRYELSPLYAKKVKIFADPQMPWTLDGEREEGHAQVDVENVHHAIRLVQRVKRDA